MVYVAYHQPFDWSFVSVTCPALGVPRPMRWWAWRDALNDAHALIFSHYFIIIIEILMIHMFTRDAHAPVYLLLQVNCAQTPDRAERN